jgi:hypothetical protein
MNRSIASWLADNPLGAILTTGLLGLLPLFGFSFAFFVPGAVPALVLLMRGAQRALLVAGGGTLLLVATMWMMGRPAPVGLVYAAWLLGPPLLLGALLLRTDSLSLCLQVAVLGGVVMIVFLHATLGDPEQFWSPFVRDLAEEMKRRGLPMQLEEETLVAMLSRTLWGWVAVLTMMLAMGALFLARWWQSLPERRGAFGAEFQQLRLGLALGGVSAVVIVASLLTDRTLVDDLARLFLAALTIIGLAAAHRLKARGALPGLWLWVLYVLLIVVAPVTVAALAGWGFVDNWLRSRPVARSA